MDNILLKIEENIAVVTINRPKQLNALDRQTFNALRGVLTEIENNTALKGVIITGAGDKAFVAGADINEVAAANGESGGAFSAAGQAVFNRIEALTIPVLALVNGFALGGGLELALACHMRYATTNAQLGLPETKLGVIPGYGGTQRLPRLIGSGRATELILTGRMVDATEALNIGLVNAVVADGEAIAKAVELIQKIGKNGPFAIHNALKAIYNGAGMTMSDALAYEQSLFALCCGSEEKTEGTNAFLEKRKAVFKK
jgi:enoyl-CoA hydratase